MIERHEHGDVLELKLDHPPANALDAGLISALRGELGNAIDGGARAVVLSGSEGMFSAGLDVPALIQLDREAILRVWDDFFGLMGDLARSPVPVCAAITGHSPAGGAVLAIFCDYRVMADAEYQIGLNEVQVGLAVPDPIVKGLGHLLGAYRAERLLVSGELMSAREAARIGLVDELVPTENTVARAVEWCEALLALPPGAMATTRTRARSGLAAIFDDLDADSLESLADAWFSEETQQSLQALVKRLKEKKEAP